MTSLIGHAWLDTADGRRAATDRDGDTAPAAAAAWLPLLRHRRRPAVIADFRLCLSLSLYRVNRRQYLSRFSLSSKEFGQFGFVSTPETTVSVRLVYKHHQVIIFSGKHDYCMYHNVVNSADMLHCIYAINSRFSN